MRSLSVWGRSPRKKFALLGVYGEIKPQPHFQTSTSLPNLNPEVGESNLNLISILNLNPEVGSPTSTSTSTSTKPQPHLGLCKKYGLFLGEAKQEVLSDFVCNVNVATVYRCLEARTPRRCGFRVKPREYVGSSKWI